MHCEDGIGADTDQGLTSGGAEAEGGPRVGGPASVRLHSKTETRSMPPVTHIHESSVAWTAGPAHTRNPVVAVDLIANAHRL